MKTVTVVVSLLIFSGVASAQGPDPLKWMCRNLSDSGGYTYQGETIFGTQACRPIPQAQPASSVAPAAAKQSAEMATVSGSVTAPVAPAAPQPAPAANVAPVAAPVAVGDGKTRVLVTDSQSWETRGGSSSGGNRNGWGGSSWMAGGARPQTAEIIKTLNERCPQITVTNSLQKADFVLTLDHEGGKGLLAHRNKVAVFNRDGDDVYSGSTRELGNSVKDACAAMLNSKR
ncbi:MAG: hypothetical protein WB559_01650 [Candidatus Acidiferrales bacterium]